MNKNGHILYISHVGGPLPILEDPSHDKMIEFMKKVKKRDGVIFQTGRK
jgi:hypothetical protein